MALTSASKNGRARGLFRAFLSKNELGAVMPLLIIYFVVLSVNPRFFSINNIFDILRTASFALIVAVPCTFLMACGGFDLSIGAVTSFGGVICAFCLKAGMPVPVAVIVALFSGFGVGFINAVVIVHYDLPPFIATLGVQYAINGIISVSTHANAISGFSAGFKMIGQTRIFGLLSTTVLYALVIGVAGHILLVYTKYGRAMLAIGGNTETAYLSGINVRAKRMSAYIATSVMAALSGVLMASRFATAQPTSGSGTELTIIAAIIIGGTSMFGGSATIVGSALGCILLATITNALIVMGVSAFWQNFIFGVILLASIFIDRYRRLASLNG
jgi:ribose transport system permease protein